MIEKYDFTLSSSYNNELSKHSCIYGNDMATNVYINDVNDAICTEEKAENTNLDIKKIKERSKTMKEIEQLKNMSEKLQKSSYKFSPIDNTVDKELTRSCWTREEIALFCLRSMNNNVEKAVKSYKSFTTMMCKFNSKNGNEIDIHNPAILSQLRTGKVVIFDKLDLHGRLLVIINLHHHDPRFQTVDDLILLFVFVLELIMIENPYEYAAERNGLSILINASKIGFGDFRVEYCLRIFQLIMKSFPIKIGQVLMFKPNRLIKFSIKLAIITKKKLKKKFQIINKVFESPDSITDFDALSHFIDRNYIPKEFGGKHDFISDNFWELKYQGHMLAELIQKRKVSTKIQEPTKMPTN
ncbi:SEC14d domain-containing protein [Cryptosporidium ubiquitum]|uniref:SEC14d domain-containing protein n=1 Tax=Cryptosporidium ubiquitum TaxID=857276 RepID=A0A1J4MIU4_9CRYT|nr:SEC14d domain-containing protein [Cryptosporidium ubiquitum]OII73935.1 SEC14d domain-containing protein [Cryptosporidium ubiquitum]